MVAKRSYETGTVGGGVENTIADCATSAVSAAGLPMSAVIAGGNPAGLESGCEHESVSIVMSGGVGGLSDGGVIN